MCETQKRESVAIDWNKPIEFKLGARVYPARRLGLLRGATCRNVISIDYGTHETAACCNDDGTNALGSFYISNVPEPKKKQWIVNLKRMPYTEELKAVVLSSKPDLKKGDSMKGFTGYQVVNVLELEQD